MLGVSTALAALGLYRSHIKCAARSAVFRAQTARLRSDANDQLGIGVSKAQVIRFFAEHNMQITFYSGGAEGTLRTTGCAPFGCGADTAFIRVHVAVDVQGTVTDHPQVTGMYTDCL